MRITIALALTLGLAGQEHVNNPSYGVPEQGLLYEVVKPLTPGNVTYAEISFGGKPRRPFAAGGCGSGDGHTGDYEGRFFDVSATGWVLTCPPAEQVVGIVQVSGRVTADIEQGIGNASVAASAAATVAYAGVIAKAEDTQAIAIASTGAPIGVGGSIQLFGTGGSFSVTVTPDQANEQSRVLNDVDTKGWRHGNAATVVMHATANGNINLVVPPSGADCSGSISGEATSGAYVAFTKLPPGDH